MNEKLIVETANSIHPGYQGIWFDLGQRNEYGSKYSGGLATYTAKHRPLAIYAEAANKTFFVYGGTRAYHQRHLYCMIGAFDHETGKLDQPRVVFDKNGVDDPHDNPSLAIDEHGFIWVLVSGRNTSRLGKIFKSNVPYSIESFAEVYEGDFTYPQPWWIEGKGFAYFYTKYANGSTRELYFSTSTDGVNWSEETKLAGMGGHYQLSEVRGARLATAFNRHPGGNVDQRTDLYYIESSDMGETWTAIDGTPVTLPLTSSSSISRVRNYSAEGRLVYVKDLNFDAQGHPLILILSSAHSHPGPGGSPRRWELVRWDGAAWQFSTITESTHNYDVGSLYVEGSLWRVIGPTEPGPQHWGQGGEVAIWESTDSGQTWTKVKDVTSGSPRNHGYVRRPVNAHNDFYAFWCDGNPDEMSEVHLYYTDRDGNAVHPMPYNME